MTETVGQWGETWRTVETVEMQPPWWAKTDISKIVKAYCDIPKGRKGICDSSRVSTTMMMLTGDQADAFQDPMMPCGRVKEMLRQMFQIDPHAKVEGWHLDGEDLLFVSFVCGENVLAFQRFYLAPIQYVAPTLHALQAFRPPHSTLFPQRSF